LLDPASADHFPLLAAARDLWPALAESLDGAAPALDRSGALFVPRDDQILHSLAERMGGLDPGFQMLEPGRAQAVAPGIKAAGSTLFTGGDWRLDPAGMLTALQEAFRREGGQILRQAVVGWAGSVAMTEAGDRLGADRLVLATGVAEAPWAKSEALRRVTPIKGQILRLLGSGPRTGPVVRAAGVYVAPSADGVIVGATMQPGRADLQIEHDAVAGLRRAAGALFPSLDEAQPHAAAGVRAATPDGLPLVGPSETNGLLLAVGARRNGWLLAPLMAETVAASVGGGGGGAFGAACDPARFIAAV
jgi:glycine oxidase